MDIHRPFLYNLERLFLNILLIMFLNNQSILNENSPIFSVSTLSALHDFIGKVM